MKRAILGNFSSFARNLLLAPPRFDPSVKPTDPITPLVGAIRSSLRLYSSESDSSRPTELENTQKENNLIEGAGDMSNEELKRLVGKFQEEGDEELLPDIFEAILMKQLKGTPGDELMKQLDLDGRDDVQEEEIDSDVDDL
ncbi:hypothetical protein Tsubulata_023961 [Turnera subulata]|uniref:Uncharacterized protein n=1 Tax=Turnera subulata TaxID=218843 RepID=A0A9Q0F7S6_9ROSI|nr:hypothetical protein Tsubulata_023961 [Turnera subulata]